MRNKMCDVRNVKHPVLNHGENPRADLKWIMAMCVMDIVSERDVNFFIAGYLRFCFNGEKKFCERGKSVKYRVVLGGKNPRKKLMREVF
jgi:hypothetical protein